VSWWIFRQAANSKSTNSKFTDSKFTDSETVITWINDHVRPLNFYWLSGLSHIDGDLIRAVRWVSRSTERTNRRIVEVCRRFQETSPVQSHPRL
jgi:hypothetical protein